MKPDPRPGAGTVAGGSDGTGGRHDRWDTITAQPIPGAPSCALGESPRWHEGAWWWVDVTAGTVFRAIANRGSLVVAPWLEAGQRVSLVHPAGPGRLLIANGSRLEIRATARPDAVERTVADLALPPGWALNDGIVGPDGSIWIGVVAPESRRGEGWLAVVTPDGTVRRAVESVMLSNGLALAPGGPLLYHADSSRRVVWRHRLDGTGVARSEPFLRFTETDGMPDGICLDPLGRLWVALYGAGEVRCHDQDGRPSASIGIPVPQATGVWIGGPDGRDVVITSAREGYTEPDRQAQPLAGATFTARLPP